MSDAAERLAWLFLGVLLAFVAIKVGEWMGWMRRDDDRR